MATIDQRAPDTRRRADDDDWGAADACDVADELGVDPERGLSAEEAGDRLADVGENRIQRVAQDPAWRVLVDQFRSPLILLLLIAAAVAGAVGEARDAIVIASVLSINAIIGFVQEYRAQKSMASLQELLTFTARVRRDGGEQEIDGAELVPGDVVLLEAGDRVPADGRILEARDVSVDESTLTGESTPVDKQTDPAAPDAPLAERTSEAFTGTSVVRGEATLIVTRTGMDTQMGQISAEMRKGENRASPLEARLGALATKLAAIALVAAATVVAVGMLRGDTFGDALIDGVVLSVASIPEGLPAIVTVTLALGMQAMAKRGAIVERLDSIHTLGATTVVCTDKTGTMTLNQMTVRVVHADDRRFEVSGEGYETDGDITVADGQEADPPRGLLEIAALCNDAELRDGEMDGDPTEGALVVLVEKAGLVKSELEQELPRIADVPFSSDRKYMATFHEDGDEIRLLVKGAPAVIFDLCSTVAGADGDVDLDDDRRREWDDRVETSSDDGLRMLALAQRRCDRPPDDASEDELAEMVDGLRLEGLVGMEDPPRPDAADSIAEAREAGIQIKMITGDHAGTARAIAERLGIEGDVIEGSELDDLDDEELAERIDHVGVLARVDPHHKVRIVDALNARGHVVAMTGDGVNDAAALERADVGVAMGQRGTEVAKEAADVVLTDDRIETIVLAVRRGRTIFDNIITFVRFNLATNLGALLTILIARVIGLPTPFTPLQVLWVNLIMDGPPAMALGADPPQPDVMQRPPRDPEAKILDRRRIITLGVLGGWMAAVTLVVFAVSRGSSDERGLTMAFTTFVLFQVFNAVNVRNGWHSVFSKRTLTNPALWIALVSVTALQVVVVQVSPVADIFGAEPLPLTGWLVAIGCASSIVVLSEAARALRRARRHDPD
jgi:P-type Ca2+ transporter type 2C